MLMSEWGRIVSVGFDGDNDDDESGDVDIEEGVMEERKRGHSCIARDSVLMINGR